MKFLVMLLGFLAFTVSVDAQYFSEGWAPGKAVPKSTASTTSFGVPGSTTASKPKPGLPSLKELLSMLDLTNLLATGPVTSLAARAGINITQKLADIKLRKFWDDRITLIDDDNYEDLIVNESFAEEDEKDRVWFVVMYATMYPNVRLRLKPHFQNRVLVRARGHIEICGPGLRLRV